MSPATDNNGQLNQMANSFARIEWRFNRTPRGVLGGCFRCGAPRMRLCACFENVQASKKSSELNDSFAASQSQDAPQQRYWSPSTGSEQDDGHKWQTVWNNDARGLSVPNWKRFKVPRKVSGDHSVAKESQLKTQIRAGTAFGERSGGLTYNVMSSRPGSVLNRPASALSGSVLSRPQSALDRPASSLDSIQSTLERLKGWRDQGLMDIDEYVPFMKPPQFLFSCLHKSRIAGTSGRRAPSSPSCPNQPASMVDLNDSAHHPNSGHHPIKRTFAKQPPMRLIPASFPCRRSAHRTYGRSRR